MAEQLRSVQVRVEIDTTKDTYVLELGEDDKTPLDELGARVQEYIDDIVEGL